MTKNSHIRHLIVLSALLTQFGCVSEDGSSSAMSGTMPEPFLNASGDYAVQPERKITLLPAEAQDGLAYPYRDGFDMKSIQPDHTTSPWQLTSANVSGVAINLVWSQWQPSLQFGGCSSNQLSFDGQCFTIDQVTDNEIRDWSNKGVNITGILWGVPEWARIGQECQPEEPGRAIFCAARSANDFGRFAGVVANRYNGLQGNGRIADFVIHNEVNMNEWYNVGCGHGVACDQEKWITDYASNFNAAYDHITAAQPAAKVFVPFAHQFLESYDKPAAARPVISVKTFLRGLDWRAGDRKWRVAYHPYSASAGNTRFSIDDLPRVTFGNIGVLAGWLRSEFHWKPEAWEIHLTESGFNSLEGSSEYEQSEALCNSFRNALGTPGIDDYIYHRLTDHPAETGGGGGGFGLQSTDGSAKLAWETWANISGRDGNRNNLNCGFENLPYTKLTSYTHSSRVARASTRVVDQGYTEGASWYLQHKFEAGTYMAYECQTGNGSYISTDRHCSGNLSLGPVGYVYEQPSPQRKPLFSCSANSSPFVSSEYACGDAEVLEFIGYVTNQR